MNGNVALRSVNKFFSGELQLCSYARAWPFKTCSEIALFLLKSSSIHWGMISTTKYTKWIVMVTEKGSTKIVKSI